MNSIDIFPWNDNFNTGITLIDEQHKKLAGLINLLASHVAFNANIPALNVIFDELAAYAVYHFESEEKIWHEYMSDDPFEMDHCKVHGSFLTEVLKLKSEEDTKPTGKVIEEILAFLTRWLAAHILESDRSMAMVVTAMRSGMSLKAAKEHAAEQMRGATKVLIDIILSIYESLSTNTLHLMHELAEQKRMSMLLDDQERHFEVLLSTTPVGIFETDNNGKCIYVNARWSEITGLSLEEAKGDGWSGALHPEDKDKIYAEWSASIEENRPFQLEYRFLHPNGKTTWVHGQSANYKSRLNDQSGYIGTITDITKRKQAENKIRDSEERLRLALISSDQSWFDFNIVTGEVSVSPEYPIMLGFDQSNFQASLQDWQENIHPEDQAHVNELFQQCLSGGGPISAEYRRANSKGDWLWINSIGSITEWNQDHQPLRMIGIHTNINQRKQAEVSLKESEFLWKFAIEGSGDGVWDWNIQTDEKIFSLRWKEILGYDESDKPTSNPRWDNRVHPEDKSRAEKAMQDYLDSVTPAYTFEGRMQCKDGAYKWVFSRGIVVSRDGAGKASRMIGTLSDITVRKHLELELTRQAHLDYLTGLSNRRHFMAQGEVELSRAIRYDTPLSLLMIDVDFFKKVNDTYGHQVGDTVLQVLSKVCQDTLRQVDIAGRIGGEEFAIILPETSSKEALEVAERLREAIANMEVNMPVGLPIHFTVSIGVTTLHDKNVNIDVLLNYADKALYEAKKTGRNKVCTG